MATTKISREVRDLNARVDALIPICRFTIIFNMQRLAQAEELRKLALRFVRNYRPGRTGQYFVGTDPDFKALKKCLAEVGPFRVPTRELPKRVRKFLNWKVRGRGTRRRK
jgi:hypothetical protein